MTTIVRKVTTLGNSIGVTLPSDMARAYGLTKGALVEIEPTDRGLLLRPVKVVSAIEPSGAQLVKDIVRRYRPALNALAKNRRRVVGR